MKTKQNWFIKVSVKKHKTGWSLGENIWKYIHKGLIFRIYTKTFKFNSKKTTTSFKKMGKRIGQFIKGGWFG